MQAHALRCRKCGEEQYGQKLLLVVAADIRLQRRKGGHRRINRERLAKRGTGQRHYGRRAAGDVGQRVAAGRNINIAKEQKRTKDHKRSGIVTCIAGMRETASLFCCQAEGANTENERKRK